jgi:hypothetical protein
MEQIPADDDRSSRDDALLWAESFVIPDDISSLEPDIAQWREEERRAQQLSRRTHYGRVFPTGMRRVGLTAPMLIVSLLLLGVLGSTMLLLGPRGTTFRRLSALPLAQTTVPAGRVGGLLPDATARDGTGSTIPLRALRPSVITIVPRGCDCRATLDHISAAAKPYGVSHHVIAPDKATLQALQTSSETGWSGLTDNGNLRTVFGGQSSRPTIVVVDASGVVRSIEIDASPSTTLNSELDAVFATSALTSS